MRYHGYRILVVVAALVVTLGILFAGGYLTKKQTIDRPLFKLYHNYKEVQNFHIDDSQEKVKITLELADTPNLSKTYNDLEQATARVLNGRPFVLDVKDMRSPALEDAYYQMHFYIQEAVTRGNFSEMYAHAQRIAQQRGLDRFALYVADDKVFVQLHQGEHYLYEIIPRTQARTASLQGGGGI